MDTFLTTMDWMAYMTGLIGAPLGMIEIFRPDLADKIESYLDFQGGEGEEGELERRAKRYVMKFQALAFIALPLIIFVLVHQIAKISPVIDDFNVHPYWWVCIWILLIISFGGIIMYMIAQFIKVLNKITDGKALGGFGVILIILGVVGDTLDKVLSF